MPSVIRGKILIEANIWIAHGGSYSIYYALAVASKQLGLDHRFVTCPADWS